MLDVREYGFVSVVEFMANFPEVVEIHRPNPQGDWILYDSRIAPPPSSDRGKDLSKHVLVSCQVLYMGNKPKLVWMY